MLGGHLADDRKEPWLKRPLGLKSTPGFVHGNQYFLTDVLNFSLIGQAPPQKVSNERTDVPKQGVKSIAVSGLSTLHELSPADAFLASQRH
jgi:hypothetical protein